MDLIAVVVSSSLVAAVVGAGTTYLAQRRLAERQAQLDYEYRARVNLYQAIGPLRFQLLLAARDVVRRVRKHHEQAWDLGPSRYYAHSLIYRLLRPLAVGQLIERQLTVVDLTLDPQAVSLIRFTTAAERVLTGGEVILDHPEADWGSETQHLFRDSLRAATSRLIKVPDDGPSVVISYAEFRLAVPDPEGDEALAPLARIVGGSGTNLTSNPIFFTRVLSYAYACAALIREQGGALGFAQRPIDLRGGVSALSDEYLMRRAESYPEVVDSLLAEGL